jgi:tape measure domain-containing protein
MAENNEYKVVFGADVSDAVAKIEQLTAAVARLAGSMQTNMGQMSGNINNSLSKLSSSLSGVGTAMTIGLTAPMALFGKSALQTAAEIEQITISFEVFTGSAEVAGQMLAQLKDQALNSPMQFQDIAKGAQTLLGYGLTAQQVVPITKMLGDISGGNSDKFGRLALAFGQVNAAGRLMGQEARQMINAGFNPLQAIADKTGKSMAQLSDDMKKGRISVKDVGDAFIAATSEGGRFYGMAERQADTLSGAYNKLKEGISFTMAEIGQKIARAFNLKEVLTNIGTFITHLKDRFNALSPETQNLIIRIATITALAGPLILAIAGAINVFVSMKTAIMAARTAMIAFELSTGNIIAIAAALIGVLGGATIAWYEYDDAVNNASENKKDAFSLAERNKQLQGQIDALKMLKALAPEVGQNTATGYQKGKKDLDQEIARLEAQIAKNKALIKKQKEDMLKELGLNDKPPGSGDGSGTKKKKEPIETIAGVGFITKSEGERIKTLIKMESDAYDEIRTIGLTANEKKLADMKTSHAQLMAEMKKAGVNTAYLETKHLLDLSLITQQIEAEKNAAVMKLIKPVSTFENFKLQNPFSKITEGWDESVISNQIDSFKNLGKSYYDAAKGLSENIAGGLGEIGGSIMLGELSVKDAFYSLGAMILNLLGDYLIKVGGAAITFGVVNTVLKNALTAGFASPESAIVAGIAAVSVGTALKGLAGKVTSSMDKNKGADGKSMTSGASGPSSRISGSTYQYGTTSNVQQSVRLFVDLTGSITQSATGYQIQKSMETTLRITGR